MLLEFHELLGSGQVQFAAHGQVLELQPTELEIWGSINFIFAVIAS